jgi:hypoxanthine phosphoribosyltransferase
VTEAAGEAGAVLLSARQIAARVRAMGRRISADLAGCQPVVVVVILKGAVIFAADLVRCLTLSLRLDFMAVASYGATTQTSGVVRILKDLDEDIRDRHVLVVEDIVDTGLTLRYLQTTLKEREPRSLRTAVLLDKVERRRVEVPVDYVGFTIPDAFVVGYGLDYDGRYRHLREVRILRPEVGHGPA